MYEWLGRHAPSSSLKAVIISADPLVADMRKQFNSVVQTFVITNPVQPCSLDRRVLRVSLRALIASAASIRSANDAPGAVLSGIREWMSGFMNPAPLILREEDETPKVLSHPGTAIEVAVTLLRACGRSGMPWLQLRSSLSARFGVLPAEMKSMLQRVPGVSTSSDGIMRFDVDDTAAAARGGVDDMLADEQEQDSGKLGLHRLRVCAVLRTLYACVVADGEAKASSSLPPAGHSPAQAASAFATQLAKLRALLLSVHPPPNELPAVDDIWAAPCMRCSKHVCARLFREGTACAYPCRRGKCHGAFLVNCVCAGISMCSCLCTHC